MAIYNAHASNVDNPLPIALLTIQLLSIWSRFYNKIESSCLGFHISFRVTSKFSSHSRCSNQVQGRIKGHVATPAGKWNLYYYRKMSGNNKSGYMYERREREIDAQENSPFVRDQNNCHQINSFLHFRQNVHACSYVLSTNSVVQIEIMYMYTSY